MATRKTKAGRVTRRRAPSTLNGTVPQAFLAFVLCRYVQVGVEELDQEKLRPLLLLKYRNAIADAVANLGRPEEIGNVFAGFQKYLYRDAA